MRKSVAAIGFGLIGTTFVAAWLSLFVASVAASSSDKAAGAKPAACPPTAAKRLGAKATFQQIMDGEVDPASEKIWTAISVTNDATGIHQREPSTPAEWQELRCEALRLAEAADLVVLSGRRVAASNKTVETQEPLDAAAIEKRLAAHPEQLRAFASSFKRVALKLGEAAGKHDVSAISKLGGELDGVCEACHQTFWYPEQQ